MMTNLKVGKRVSSAFDWPASRKSLLQSHHNRRRCYRSEPVITTILLLQAPWASSAGENVSTLHELENVIRLSPPKLLSALLG